MARPASYGEARLAFVAAASPDEPAVVVEELGSRGGEGAIELKRLHGRRTRFVSDLDRDQQAPRRQSPSWLGHVRKRAFGSRGRLNRIDQLTSAALGLR